MWKPTAIFYFHIIGEVFNFFRIMKLIDLHDELGTSHGTVYVEILSRMPAFVSGNHQL